MKKRTKLMLGLSAMLLATAGVAATGTFAWYTASAAPTVSSAVYNSSAIGTTTTTIEMGNVTIEFSIAAISGVQLTNAVAENETTTLYKGMVSGSVNQQTGVVTNGAVSTTALTAAEGTSGSFIKEYVVTATFQTATAQQKAALAGYHVEATLTATGYAKLRADQAVTGADDSSHTLTVSFDGTDSISVTGEKFVRIQAKETGASQLDLIADHDNDKLRIAALSAVTPTNS